MKALGMQVGDQVIVAGGYFGEETGEITWTDGFQAEIRFHKIAASAFFEREELRCLKRAGEEAD
jgi:hypothetical protein